MQKNRKYYRLHELRKQSRLIAAILVILLGISLLLTISRITAKCSNGHEQFIVMGHAVDTQAVAHCLSNHARSDSIQTESWEDIVNFLGYEPYLIYPSGWLINSYSCHIMRRSIKLYVYASYQGQDINLCITTFNREQDIYIAVELSEVITETDINGYHLSCIRNIDKTTYVWIDGTSVYALYGGSIQGEIASLLQNFRRDNN